MITDFFTANISKTNDQLHPKEGWFLNGSSSPTIWYMTDYRGAFPVLIFSSLVSSQYENHRDRIQKFERSVVFVEICWILLDYIAVDSIIMLVFAFLDPTK